MPAKTNLKQTILVVDDESSIRESFSLILGDNYNLLLAASGEAGVNYVACHKLDLVFLDIRMPGMNGIEALKHIRRIDPEVVVVMVTAVNEVEKASTAVHTGAIEYLVKPFGVDEVLKLTEKILTKKLMSKELKKMIHFVPELIGQDDKILRLKGQLKKLAGKKEGRGIIYGEEGTEKVWIAQIIHFLSGEGEFKMIDLSPYRGEELGRKLFGHVEEGPIPLLGKEKGILDSSENDTIFIDHINLLPADLQERMLNFSLKGRIVCSSSVNLKELDFNLKLYERLSDLVIEIPPLRERVSDIHLFLNYFLERFGREFGKNIKDLPPEINEILTSYAWPGNIDELASVVKQIVISSSGSEISLKDIPLRILCNKDFFPSIPFTDISDEFAGKHVKEVLDKSNGDFEKASRFLGVSEQVLKSYF
jgi:DNA-binding NtrC family response regulator